MPRPWLIPELIERARTLVQGGAGRRSLMDALNLSEDKAKTLLAEVKRGEAIPESRDPHILEDFTAAVRGLPALHVKRVTRPVLDEGLDPEDIVLHISDVHVGSLVSPEATGGLGGYNFGIFTRRVERYRLAVQKILRYVPNKIERAYVVFGGDTIEGQTIFRGQQRQTDLGVTQQVVRAYEAFAQLLADLMAMGFEEVVVTGVPGNHARIGKWGELAPESNLDLLLLYFLRERFHDVPGIRFHVPETWWALLKVRGWTFLVAHGDEFKSWLRIPFYGALGFRSRMRELLHESFPREFAADADFDYVLVGHHHEPAAFSGLYLNGSWVGGSEFSLKTLQAGGLPFQQVMGIHEHIGVSWHRKIVLEDRRTLPRPIVFE